MAQTLMHPANTYKTMLQLKGATPANLMSKLTPERLLRGADAQFLLSMPHGALYFFVIDRVKSNLATFFSASKFSFLQDFAASTISTVFCSIVSTPQMVSYSRTCSCSRPRSRLYLLTLLFPALLSCITIITPQPRPPLLTILFLPLPPPHFQVLTDRLMAGMYPSLPAAMRSIIRSDGLAGFYTGWWPALAQKIPSYG